MTRFAPTYEPSTFPKSLNDAADGEVPYDDTWLRDAIGVIRSDVREMRSELKDHMKDDACQWRELHDSVDAVGSKIQAVNDRFAERERMFAAVKWVIALLFGSGGIFTLFKFTGKL